MKAAILESLDNLSVQEVPEPEIDDDAALMRVEAVSICGSDVRILHHGNPRVEPPTIIGHENSGCHRQGRQKRNARQRRRSRVPSVQMFRVGSAVGAEMVSETTATSTTLSVTRFPVLSRNI